MKYSELHKEKTVFGKISKSSEDIAWCCTEVHHFVDYQHSFVVRDRNPEGHNALSFAPIGYLVAFLSYGDTYTELETNPIVSKVFLGQQEVNVINSPFREYTSSAVLVRRNISLKKMSVQLRLIREADPGMLCYATNPLFDEMLPSVHFGILGFAEACELWAWLEERAEELRKVKESPERVGWVLQEEVGKRYG